MAPSLRLPLSTPRTHNEFYDVHEDEQHEFTWLALRDGTCDERQDYLRRPVAILQQMSNPSIEGIFATGDHEGKFLAAIRRANGGHLRSYMKKEQHADVVGIARQLVDTVVYLHTPSQTEGSFVIHGNIHPTNVLMHNDKPILSNFALCHSSTTAAVPGVQDDGHLAYKAPELLQGGQPRTRDTDVYALGMLLYEMFTGQEPFEGLTAVAAAQQVLDGSRPLRGALPHGARGDAIWNIITQCWAEASGARSTAQDVRDALHALV